MEQLKNLLLLLVLNMLTWFTCCSSLILALVRVLTLSSSICRSSSACCWASCRAFFSLSSFATVSSKPVTTSVRFLTYCKAKYLKVTNNFGPHIGKEHNELAVRLPKRLLPLYGHTLQSFCYISTL